MLVSDTKFEPLLRGPSTRKITSHGLNWKGLLVEVHRAEPGARPESTTESLILGLWRGATATGYCQKGRVGEVLYAKPPGSITFAPPGLLPAVRACNSFEVALCAIEPAFLRELETEHDGRWEMPPYRTGFFDAPLRHLITLLTLEAGHGGPSGSLYAEHLVHALMMRALCLDTRFAQPAVSPLPRNRLQRVLDRMMDCCADLNLETLAAESGYSRSHFLRMFQAATGVTPYRYLLQVRLERAKEMMKQGHAPLVEVAERCGFSSHSHMTRVFRHILKVTPSEYRRS